MVSTTFVSKCNALLPLIISSIVVRYVRFELTFSVFQGQRGLLAPPIPYLSWTQWESNPNNLFAKQLTYHRHLAHIFLWDGRDSNSMRFGFTYRPTCPGHHPKNFCTPDEIRTRLNSTLKGWRLNHIALRSILK
jgi:hypothetical protein